MTEIRLHGESKRTVARAPKGRCNGETIKAMAKVAMLLPIVVMTGTIRGSTVIIEDGEDNTLDLCIGPAG